MEQKPDFDNNMKRLEEIITEMEGGRLSLDRMMELYTEGAALLASCSSALEAFEKKINNISNADGADHELS